MTDGPIRGGNCESSSKTTEPSSITKPPSVALVIPGRNCAATLDRCLTSVVPLMDSGQLTNIIFVNDGSTDATSDIASRYPVETLIGKGQGPGSARNLGWQAAECELIWFIDSDCVAAPDALETLLPHLGDPEVAGAGGSYSNLFPDSLVATLIHEEIVTRHKKMGQDVDFLATFNVVYRRSVLEATGGFDEDLKLAQDAEFAYRVRAAGHRLRFELTSRVGHHHPRNIWRYFRTQARQGYYRVMLYRQHPLKAGGDSYSGILDFLPPPLGFLLILLMPAVFLDEPRLKITVVKLLVLLILLHVPNTIKLVRQMGISMLNYLWFGSLRAIARGVGLACGLASVTLDTVLGLQRGIKSGDANSGLST